MPDDTLTSINCYSRGAERCLAKGKQAPNHEIAELWASIASSYLFLLERERRLTAEEAERDKQPSQWNST